MATSRPPDGPSKRRRHSKEFKKEAVALAQRDGIGFPKAAQSLGVHESMLRRWEKQLRREGSDAFRGNGKRTAVQAELERLRRENADLREERDILKKAALYFAKEDDR
jgi:transposase